MQNLKEKQDKEFDEKFMTSIKFGGFPRELLLEFLDKVRKETAECVCSEMDIIDREERKQKREQIIENL